MTDELMQRFLARAEQLGHSRTELLRNGSQTTMVTVHDLEELQALVRDKDPEMANLREQHLAELTKSRQRTIPEDIESYLYGNGELTTLQLRIVKTGFPVEIIISSVVDRTMAHGETVIGPSAAPTVWNYGTLRFYSDSYLTVKNTYLTLTAQQLFMQYSDSGT